VLIAAGVAIGSYATAIGVSGGFLITPLLLILHPDVEPKFRHRRVAERGRGI